MNEIPDSTVHNAANALILSACISLWEQRSSNHISRKPIPNKLMYMNSDVMDSQSTPLTRSQKEGEKKQEAWPTYIHIDTEIYHSCMQLIISPCVSSGVRSRNLRHRSPAEKQLKHFFLNYLYGQSNVNLYSKSKMKMCAKLESTYWNLYTVCHKYYHISPLQIQCFITTLLHAIPLVRFSYHQHVSHKIPRILRGSSETCTCPLLFPKCTARH